MKKIPLFLLMIIVAISTIGCTKEKNSVKEPEETIEASNYEYVWAGIVRKIEDGTAYVQTFSQPMHYHIYLEIEDTGEYAVDDVLKIYMQDYHHDANQPDTYEDLMGDSDYFSLWYAIIGDYEVAPYETDFTFLGKFMIGDGYYDRYLAKSISDDPDISICVESELDQDMLDIFNNPDECEATYKFTMDPITFAIVSYEKVS